MNSKILDNTPCPCCSNMEFANCCKPIIEKGEIAKNPLALMRSRFTAHVLKNIDHIIKTMKGRALKLFDKEATEKEWFEGCDWTKLEIIDAPDIKPEEKEGIVEFKAYYLIGDAENVLHERSIFNKIGDSWYYVSGKHKQNNLSTSNKVGRNDPCTCGSGKKYKKCCG